MPSDSRLNDLLTRWQDLQKQGVSATVEDVCEHCPELAPELTELIQTKVLPDAQAAAAESVGPALCFPTKLGRYKLHERLGAGSFGTVFRAYDEELERWVAIKVPHAWRFQSSQGVSDFLQEARKVAQLDHPNILTVYDAGQAEGYCYVVYKFVEGSTLLDRAKRSQLTHSEVAQLVAQIAEALDYAHHKGLYHRDIKPGNILLDKDGKPYVADFGLAVREAELSEQKSRRVGTVPYMSPEQLRGEGHRIDGRTDIYSLGVVLYELLCGRRPFDEKSKDSLVDEILHREARPPRQVKDSIPRELERICLKAMAKRVTDRYTTGKDMCEELQHAHRSFGSTFSAVNEPVVPPASLPAASANSGSVKLDSVRESYSELPIRIVPQGLRSFGPEDSDFFLELLPGPKNREGLPDSVRFWRTQIECRDASRTFSVGLIYGPSGCGKSSLVKAGLMPRLSPWIATIYLEATREDTENRLLMALRKAYPALGTQLSLAEMVAELRRGQCLPDGRKLLIVIDQFEQWLHVRGNDDDTELLRALRQCDGEHVQCIVMVRDDFWVAITRFMRNLEIRLLEGQNIGLVDLFDPAHARKVLTAFGRAFGRLPENPGKLSADERRFLDQAVLALTQNNEIFPVRLSLFAEMLKGKPWTSATLKQVGGIEGLGVTFLEETFSARTANPEHRIHEKAARDVLRALLPEHSVEIKGLTRSNTELLAASGYTARPQRFAELLGILDNELRLVTPADPEGQADDSSVGQPGTGPGKRVYQLAHDFLVPSVRDWLTRKQKETRRGRAELRLADWSAQWHAKPVPRNLPGAWNWANILCFTSANRRGEAERKMLHAATRRHVERGLATLTIILAAALAGLTVQRRIAERMRANHAADLVKRLSAADIAQVPTIVAEIKDYGKWVNPRLRELVADSAATARQQLHARLALVPVDPSQVQPLRDAMLDASPQELAVISHSLLPAAQELSPGLWQLALYAQADRRQRLRAAAALAVFDSDNANWDKATQDVVSQLVAENPLLVSHWMSVLRPIQPKLFQPLKTAFLDRTQLGPSNVAALVLAEYAADQPDLLCDLLELAEDRQIGAFTIKLKAHGERVVPRLQAKLTERPAQDADDEAKELLAKQQANAAVGLLMLRQDQPVWPLLRHTDEPRVRSYVIHRAALGEVDPQLVIERFATEKDDGVRRALIFTLGEYESDRITPTMRDQLEADFLERYRADLDSGIRSAIEWLLRKWERDGQLPAIDAELISTEPTDGRRWFVNSQGHTMVIITPGPPLPVPNSKQVEHPTRTYEIATKEVTIEQFQRFRNNYQPKAEFGADPTCPVNNISMQLAMEYCQWLSRQENFPESELCYEKSPETDMLVLKEDGLSRKGYRLPTEAEWEYACRAGTVTSRHYGDSEELLGFYAYFLENSWRRAWPVGRLKPNDYGLFDALGNSIEWCHPRTSEASTQGMIRGGSFMRTSRYARSDYRLSASSSFALVDGSFRVAKTCP